MFYPPFEGDCSRRKGKRGGESRSDESQHWPVKTHPETTPRRSEKIGTLADKEAREKPRGFADFQLRREKASADARPLKGLVTAMCTKYATQLTVRQE